VLSLMIDYSSLSAIHTLSLHDALPIYGVNALRAPDRAFLVITHYQRLLDYIKPDFVHVLADGRIVESGGPELALQLEAHGYEWLDRKSTRLNSSHVKISYAVFCLKKKK